MKLSHIPLRVAAGAFILNSGLAKRGVPPEAAEGMQGMASAGIPQLASLDAQTFAKLLSAGEITLGAALLTPFVSSTKAGLGLTAFGAGLMSMYLNVPGMREEGSLKPTQEGNGLAKDVWLLGAGLTLLLDGVGSHLPGKS